MPHPTELCYTTFGYQEESDSVEVVRGVLRKVYGAGASYSAFDRVRAELREVCRRLSAVRTMNPAFAGLELSPFVQAALSMQGRGGCREGRPSNGAPRPAPRSARPAAACAR